jgi:hypothetical protein
MTRCQFNLLAKQSTEMSNAVYQNCLALGYLLSSDRGVCGKFSQSNCFLPIDNNEKRHKKITDQMRKLAHVPVKT